MCAIAKVECECEIRMTIIAVTPLRVDEEQEVTSSYSDNENTEEIVCREWKAKKLRKRSTTVRKTHIHNFIESEFSSDEEYETDCY